jgi:hypothetical protein
MFESYLETWKLSEKKSNQTSRNETVPSIMKNTMTWINNRLNRGLD